MFKPGDIVKMAKPVSGSDDAYLGHWFTVVRMTRNGYVACTDYANPERVLRFHPESLEKVCSLPPPTQIGEEKWRTWACLIKENTQVPEAYVEAVFKFLVESGWTEPVPLSVAITDSRTGRTPG